MALIQANDFARAKSVCADLCRQHDQDAEGWFLYGAVCGQLGELESAAGHFGKAIALRPDVPAVHFNLGVIRQRLGLYAAAENSHQQAITLDPNLIEAHLELGNALHAQGQQDRAIACYQHALNLRPDLAAAHYYLGNVHLAAGDIAAAINDYTRATQLAPGLTAAYFQLGLCATAQGRIDDEIAMYRKAVDLQPAHVDALNNLGLALKKAGKLDETISTFRRIIALRPDYYQAHANLGMALQDADQLDEAESCFEAAIRLRPDLAETHYNLGGLLYFRNAISRTEQVYRKALALNPKLEQAHVNLGNLLLRQGRHQEGIAHFREAVAIRPDFIEAQSNVLFALNYPDDCPPQSLWLEHHEFGQRIIRQAPHRLRPTNEPDPGRTLSIGYVSADFRMHATAHFLEPVLEKHDRQRVRIYCYANQAIEDNLTGRFRAYADHWRDIHDLSDEAAAQLIAEDKIDILVDLSGHTHGARLPLFAMEPAPIQVTWLGYINTTGLDTMDYRIVDALACPPGMFDEYHAEQLLRMPHTQWCYRPPEDAPDIGASPAELHGHVTFASVSNSAKITDSMLAVWMDILAAIPKSRLLMVGNALEFRHDMIKTLARDRAVEIDRIEYIPEQSFPGYLALHQRIDVNLDTFPYCGGATTCHSLWMGVPVITMTGNTVVSRGGASLLHAAGLDGLIADSTAGYIETAVRLAGDIPSLAELRRGLRQRMQASRLTDAATFTRELEKLYRDIWTAWCRNH